MDVRLKRSYAFGRIGGTMIVVAPNGKPAPKPQAEPKKKNKK